MEIVLTTLITVAQSPRPSGGHCTTVNKNMQTQKHFPSHQKHAEGKLLAVSTFPAMACSCGLALLSLSLQAENSWLSVCMSCVFRTPPFPNSCDFCFIPLACGAHFLPADWEQKSHSLGSNRCNYSWSPKSQLCPLSILILA